MGIAVKHSTSLAWPVSFRSTTAPELLLFEALEMIEYILIVLSREALARFPLGSATRLVTVSEWVGRLAMHVYTISSGALYICLY